MTAFDPKQTFKSSFRLERNLDICALEHNSASLPWRDAAVARRVHLRKRPRLERRQPQPEKVTMPLGLGPVLEIGARVQDLVVVQQLDVPWAEIHREMDRRVVAQVVEEVHGRDLAAREPPRRSVRR